MSSHFSPFFFLLLQYLIDDFIIEKSPWTMCKLEILNVMKTIETCKLTIAVLNRVLVLKLLQADNCQMK